MFQLCYIDSDKSCAYFTDNFEKQWGDDWDDAPYEHNAGTPYESWNELVKDSENIFEKEWEVHPIKIKKVHFETNDYTEHTPCTGELNSPYSVKDINRGVVAWLWTDKFSISAGTTLEEFIKTIQNNGGEIYVKLETEE